MEARAVNLGPSAIAWSSCSVAMVSISSYEIDRAELRPNLNCRKSMSRSLSVHLSINSDSYKHAIRLKSSAPTKDLGQQLLFKRHIKKATVVKT